MEALNQKSLDRVVSQRAFLMGSSFPCQICVFGFLCGVCLTSLFLAALTSFGASSSGSISFSPFSTGISASNSTSPMDTSRDCSGLLKEGERIMYSKESVINHGIDEKVALLYTAWSNSLSESIEKEGQSSQNIRLSKSNVPEAPHLENCKLSAEVSQRLDTRLPNRTFPPWTIWKGMLDDLQLSMTDKQLKYYRDQMISEGAYPPWITGSDMENYPLTRKVQRDLWLHQHPENCRDPTVKFLVVDWERLPGFGIGAQLAGMCGLLAIAINEKRVLVTGYYNRADHDGCKGSSRASWSCYFFPETSHECRKRAFELMNDKVAWENGVITGKDNYTSRDIWSGRTPRAWGNPWSIMQPTTEINGSLIVHHRKMDRRWWRAQAVRYLMRFQSEYTCNLMNIARHTAFGREAAEMVLTSSSGDLIEDVIDRSKSYQHWKFYYTNVTRQTGNITMATYEASLGRETSTNYPIVNFLMAAEADFFIGALGSTWCFLIDGMRNTGGKVMSGYLSVNKDRFWRSLVESCNGTLAEGEGGKIIAGPDTSDEFR
ncbi:hypothetical protein Sango_0761900 [Sesamum angolense]|uniref:Alpha-(1,6)-fucosyltransferase n=1 Tax=Sesamum angolense TaxID=2727404 RepID=A0AAE1X2W6_9LAMI|nr:hypothetical protein Sango_0761900 [Sesamum angolense]